jgi:hypothetical protein
MQGRLADTIFFPPSIHPDLRAMFNPEYLRRFRRDGKTKVPVLKRFKYALTKTFRNAAYS